MLIWNLIWHPSVFEKWFEWYCYCGKIKSSECETLCWWYITFNCSRYEYFCKELNDDLKKSLWLDFPAENEFQSWFEQTSPGSYFQPQIKETN